MSIPQSLFESFLKLIFFIQASEGARAQDRAPAGESFAFAFTITLLYRIQLFVVDIILRQSLYWCCQVSLTQERKWQLEELYELK